MEIERTTSNEEAWLIVRGCLDTASAAEFARAVDAAATGAKTLVFDLTGLEFISSLALRKLVSVGKELAAHGGKVVITGMGDVVREVFDITGLNEVFEIR